MHPKAPNFQRFSHSGLEFSYFDEGERDGAPTLLIHGFASSALVNWVNPGWVHSFVQHGRRVIGIDNRGHGGSAKPHDSAAYHPSLMAGDAAALLDHLGIAEADVFGYSMGARISAFLALEHSERVRSIVWGGLGIGLVHGVGDWDPIAAALLTERVETITDQRGLMFRTFADKTGSDRLALAACIASNRVLVTEAEAARIVQPVLIGVGTRDDIAGDPHALASLLPDARVIDIPNRDHMLAVGDRVFKTAVLAFYDEIASA
jgi:pimeloyl-ACP methyl ester carboxylesterase